MGLASAVVFAAIILSQLITSSMLAGGGLMLLWRFGALMVSGARAVGTLGIRELQAMTATIPIKQTHIPKGRPQTKSV